MDLAEILKVIIPLVIMAVWAMNLLFNKEVQSPARPMRPMGGSPPQDGPPPLPGQRAAFEYGYSPTAPYARPYDDEAAAARRAQVTPREENYPSVMAVDPRTLRRPVPSSGSSWQGTSGGPRRSQKAKAPKKSESAPKGLPTLSQNMTITSNIGKMGTAPIQFTPLSKQQDAATTEADKAAPQVVILAQQLRDRAKAPAQIREAILMSEILKPPLALRKGAGFTLSLDPRNRTEMRPPAPGPLASPASDESRGVS